MSRNSILALLFVAFLIACNVGYSPPDELIEPDPALCFDEGIITKNSGGKLELNIDECGSLKGTKVEFQGNSISKDTYFKLTVGTEFIESPSYILNYAVKLEMTDPTDTEISGNAYVTIPFVSSILTEDDYSTVDVSMFLNSTASEISVIDQSQNEKDDNLKTIKTLIDQAGTFEPGVQIYEAMNVGNFKEINFGSSDASFITEVSGGEEFVFMLTDIPGSVISGLTTSSSQTSAYTIESSEMPQTVAKRIASAKSSYDEGELKRKISLDGEFLDRLKDRIAARPTAMAYKTDRSIVASMTFPNDPPEVGDEVTGIKLWDYSDYPNSTLLTDEHAIVHAVGLNSIIMVHTPADYADLISNGYGDELDDLSTAVDNIILPRDTFFFGEPSDVDDNGRLIILLTHTLSGTGILGFYYNIDVFINDGVSWQLGGYNDSNEADMVYSVFPSEDVDVLLLKNIIAHEFQHLINFNNKTLGNLSGYPGNTPVDPDLFEDNTPFEKLFLNEGLSHFAEDVVGYADVNSGIPHILNHPHPNYGAYLQHNWNRSMIDTSGLGTIAMRAQNYLFVRYLYEQAGGAVPLSGADYTDMGGAAFLKSMIASTYTGIPSISNAFAGVDTDGREFLDAYMDWLVALFNDKYDEILNSNTKYNYLSDYTDLVTAQTVGLDLSSTRTLADGSEYSPVELDGPTVQDFEGSTAFVSEVAVTGAAFVRYKVPTTPTNSVIRFSIDGDSLAALRGRIMRTE